MFSLQEAQQRLEETHREKVTRVMKDWSDLEEKYQDMRMADPKSAQSFKQRMTARFQVRHVKTFDFNGNAFSFCFHHLMHNVKYFQSKRA